jgi:hypothetical protein
VVNAALILFFFDRRSSLTGIVENDFSVILSKQFGTLEKLM